MPSNTGTEGDRREALKAIADLTRIQIGLSTGAVILSATFLEKFYKGEVLETLVAAWACFGLSVLFGLMAYGQYVSQLAESNLTVRRGALECLSLLQWAALAAALGLFGYFVVTNVTAGT